MKAMLKTSIPIDGEWHLVTTGDVAYVGQQTAEAITFWWEDDGNNFHERHLRVYGTGRQIDDRCNWVGTVQDLVNGLVWHLYEAQPARRDA